MSFHVVVRFSPRDEIDLPAKAPMPGPEARAWLDAEVLRLGCEPLRASGKTLLVDKLLAIAQSVGQPGFGDAVWASRYADAAAGALGRAYISVDLSELTVGY